MILKLTAAAGAAVLALSTAVLAQTPDSKVLAYTLPADIVWTPTKDGPLVHLLWGDPTKAGPYAMLVKWPAHAMSRPHTHPNDRHVTVISGTWWVGAGTVYDPDHTTPMPAGAIVTHFANEPHYDGAKDAPCIIEIVGQGPAPTIPVH